jgi:hypothetical protein
VAGGLIFGNAFPLSEGCTGTFPEFARARQAAARAAHAPEPMAAPEEALSAEPTPAAGASPTWGRGIPWRRPLSTGDGAARPGSSC